jgi:hypothetical protein
MPVKMHAERPTSTGRKGAPFHAMGEASRAGGILAESSDWRFLNEVERELKI